MLRPTRHTRLWGPLLLLASLVPATSVSAKPNADGIEWFKGKMFGVLTDNAGQVRQVVLDQGKDAELKIVNTSCPTKIADLPHIANAIGKSMAVRVKDGCIDRYQVDGW